MVLRSAGKEGVSSTRGGSSFRSALDPGLLSVEGRNVADGKGKGRAIDVRHADLNRPGRHQLKGGERKRSAAGLGAARTAALGLSTASPRWKQQREYSPGVPEATTSASNESTESTIGSFSTTLTAAAAATTTTEGVKKTEAIIASPHQVYDMLSAERRREASREVTAREKRLRDEIGRRTSYASKRRRKTQSEGKDSAAPHCARDGAAAASITEIAPARPITDTADALWNDIWGRWEQSNEGILAGTDGDSAVAAATTTLGLYTAGPPPAISAVEEEEEGGDALTALHSSQVSLQSDNGQFKTQFSFYHFPSQDTFGVGESGGDKELDDGQLIGTREVYDDFFIVQRQEDSIKRPAALADLSGSRIDEKLLLEDEDGDDDDDFDQMTQAKVQSAEEMELQSRQRRIEGICKESNEDIHPVGHIIFAGREVCQRYFAPAWDGYRLRTEPPGRADLAAWGITQKAEQQGQLYDYEGELEAIPHWRDD